VRYLTVVRHAESTPARAGERDYDRGLSPVGRAECDALREWASDPDALGAYGPVTALVSGARRTRETFERAFEGTAFVERVEFSDLIYNGHRAVGAEDLLIDLAAIDPVTSSLALVAHNPSVLELVAEICVRPPGKVRRGRYPTGAAYVIALPDDEPIAMRRYELAAKFVPRVEGD
jgi:phosphohistidine phosphatase